MPYQRTIAQTVECTGVGIHSGESVRVRLGPAPDDHGVVFVRRDGGRVVEIPARAEHVASTSNATTLSRDGASVSTVEHLLAALRGVGIDNVRVEVDADELPAMDGSAAPFVDLLRGAGSVQQKAVRQVLVVERPLECGEGDRRIRIEPAARGLALDYRIDFAHPSIGRQSREVAELSPAVFAREIAPARTFGFYDQVEALRGAGLARGASLDNTIVLDARTVMNREGLRFPDEFVRHKLLDLVGDLALLGHPLRGRVVVERGGHALHRALVDALRVDPDAWSLAPDAELAVLPPVGAAKRVASV